LSVNGQPQWYTVTGGSKVYVERLIEPFKNKIRLSCGVTKVTRQNDKVQITDSGGETHDYDHVIFACHAPEVLPVLKDATENEKSIFGVFRHQKNTAVLHKNSAIMPRRRACWSSWIYHAKNIDGAEPIAVTYWMNYLQGIDNQYPLFVTLNPPHAISAADIFDRHDFYHPIYSPASVAAQPKIASLQGQNNTWFCGAYNRYGFHEDGLSSAVEMAARMGVEPSWH
jgi:predicted NAD/FAD-binding protein